MSEQFWGITIFIIMPIVTAIMGIMMIIYESRLDKIYKQIPGKTWMEVLENSKKPEYSHLFEEKIWRR